MIYNTRTMRYKVKFQHIVKTEIYGQSAPRVDIVDVDEIYELPHYVDIIDFIKTKYDVVGSINIQTIEGAKATWNLD